jgi:hypothetical protein
VKPIRRRPVIRTRNWTMSTTFLGVLFALLPMFMAARAASIRKADDESAADQQQGEARTPTAQTPFSCDRLALTPEVRKRHFEELGPMLLSLKKGVRELPGGYAFEFPSDERTFTLLTEWSNQEGLCCPFFDIDLRFDREGGPLWLRLTGRPGTKDFIRVDAAKWLQR